MDEASSAPPVAAAGGGRFDDLRPALFWQRFFPDTATGCGAGPITGTGKMEATGPIDLGDRGIVAQTRCKAGSNAGAAVHLLGNGRGRRVRRPATFARVLAPRTFLAAALGSRGIAGHVCRHSRTIQEIHFRDRNAEDVPHENRTTTLARDARGAAPSHRSDGAAGRGRRHHQGRNPALAVGHDGDQRDHSQRPDADADRRSEREGRPARQEDRAGGGRPRLELAAVRGEGARTDQPRQGRRGVRLLDLGVAQIRAAGVRGAQRPAVLSARI